MRINTTNSIVKDYIRIFPHRKGTERVGYKIEALSDIETYLPGWGRLVIWKADDLGT